MIAMIHILIILYSPLEFFGSILEMTDLLLAGLIGFPPKVLFFLFAFFVSLFLIE